MYWQRAVRESRKTFNGKQLAWLVEATPSRADEN